MAAETFDLQRQAIQAVNHTTLLGLCPGATPEQRTEGLALIQHMAEEMVRKSRLDRAQVTRLGEKLGTLFANEQSWA